MFIGHFGVGFGAKAGAPQVSLGSLFLAAQFADLLWPSLLLLGIERVRIMPDATQPPGLDFVYYPFSHSLLALGLWAGLFALVYFGLRRSRAGAAVLAMLVVSHWLLDLLVHAPDLPLYPGSAQLAGLGLWSFPIAAMLLELVIFACGMWFYVRRTKALDTSGKWALWALAAFLVLIHVADTFGPPPPSAAAVAWVGQAQWLFVLWGYWIDRHRAPIAAIR